MTDRQLQAELELIRAEMQRTQYELRMTRIRHQQSVEEWESIIRSLHLS